jgi:hypothetical protein
MQAVNRKGRARAGAAYRAQHIRSKAEGGEIRTHDSPARLRPDRFTYETDTVRIHLNGRSDELQAIACAKPISTIYTADTIAAALLEVQHEGIVAIPYVDALICQEKDRERVCEVVGRRIFNATGVCCLVGGIRYSPLTEDEKQALAFDEIAPSDDGMDYDEWEAMRAVRTAAVLKLTRFIQQAVGVTAFDSQSVHPTIEPGFV